MSPLMLSASRRSLLALVFLPALGHAQQSFFGGIGDLAGGNTNSAANRLSGNGLVVVGESFDAGGIQGVRYTRAGGLQKLDRLTGNLSLQGHVATAVNFDGSVVAGNTSGSAVRWNAAGAVTKLNDLFGGSESSSAFAVSADGRYIAGAGTNSQGKGPVRWQNPNVNPQQIAGLPGGPGGFAFYGQINGINADATVFVGSSASRNTGNETQLQEAYYYSETTGDVALGDLPGGRFNSRALATSGDGKTIVGFGTTGANNNEFFRHAFRWTAASGMVDLRTAGGKQSQIGAISSDGAFLGGYSDFSLSGNGDPSAAIWTATRGWVRAETLFAEAGVDVAGWSLGNVSGIQNIGDTLYLCGSGSRNGVPEGWYAGVSLAPVPEPASLAALALGVAALLRRRKRA